MKTLPGSVTVLRAALLLPVLLLPAPASAQEQDQGLVGVALTGTVEYDDNLLLSDSETADPTGDTVLRLEPTISLEHLFEEHSLGLSMGGNLRHGLETEITDLNLSATGSLDLRFPRGLQLHLADTYTRISFDQELSEEAGIPDSTTNVIAAGLSYTLVERLKIETSYRSQHQRFEIAETSTFSALSSAQSDRRRQSVSGKLSVPVTRSIVASLSATEEEQNAGAASTRSYLDTGYRLGVEWKGRRRLVLRAGIGHQSIDFAEQAANELPETNKPSTSNDLSGTTARLEAEIGISSNTKVELAVGRDGYGEATYATAFKISAGDEPFLRLSAKRETLPSYSFVYDSLFYTAQSFGLSLHRKIGATMTCRLGARYQHQESALAGDERDDRLLAVRVDLEYPIQSWLELAVHLERSARESVRAGGDLTNNRGGIAATVRF